MSPPQALRIGRSARWEIGVGLPNSVQDVDAESLVEFARRADARGFSSLGTIDRIVYPNFEQLVALEAVAAVTERIRLATTVLLGPLRRNSVLLAKELLTLDNLSGGRFWLGIALGGREDDYGVSGIPTKDGVRRSTASSSRSSRSGRVTRSGRSRSAAEVRT